jgi:hypothetical protein
MHLSNCSKTEKMKTQRGVLRNLSNALRQHCQHLTRTLHLTRTRATDKIVFVIFLPFPILLGSTYLQSKYKTSFLQTEKHERQLEIYIQMDEIDISTPSSPEGESDEPLMQIEEPHIQINHPTPEITDFIKPTTVVISPIVFPSLRELKNRINEYLISKI